MCLTDTKKKNEERANTHDDREKRTKVQDDAEELIENVSTATSIKRTRDSQNIVKKRDTKQTVSFSETCVRGINRSTEQRQIFSFASVHPQHQVF